MKTIVNIIIARYQFHKLQPKVIKITHGEVIKVALNIAHCLRAGSTQQIELIKIEHLIVIAEKEGDKHKLSDLKILFNSISFSMNKFFA